MRAMLDWGRVRAELRSLRSELGLTREQLERASGVEQTTIYRIENTKKLPDHKPDFDSIEALVTGMGLTLSEFFVRIEGLKAQPVPSTDQRSNGGDRAPVSRLPLDDTNAIIARNTAALDELIEVAKLVAGELRTAREQAPSARARPPARDARRRKAG